MRSSCSPRVAASGAGSGPSRGSTCASMINRSSSAKNAGPRMEREGAGQYYATTNKCNPCAQAPPASSQSRGRSHDTKGLPARAHSVPVQGLRRIAHLPARAAAASVQGEGVRGPAHLPARSLEATVQVGPPHRATATADAAPSPPALAHHEPPPCVIDAATATCHQHRHHRCQSHPTGTVEAPRIARPMAARRNSARSAVAHR